jgi:2-dehydro-3-deoxygluconokinase
VTGVLCIGELMVELSCRPDGTARIGFGGDTFNTAAYLSRLGQPTAYLSAFGDDPWSDDARALLLAEGVDDSACPVVAGRTMGLYAIRTAASGERSFTYWRDSAPVRDLFGTAYSPVVEAAILSARLIYLSGVTLWLYDTAGLDRLFGLLAQARQAGATVAFDGNYRPRLWGTDRTRTQDIYARMLALTDICLATYDDEAALWDDTDPKASLARLGGAGIPEVVVKCGAEGAWISPHTRVATIVIARPVDTTAAGDSFNAAYLSARLGGLPPAHAAEAGNRLAGVVVTQPGALIPRDAMP